MSGTSVRILAATARSTRCRAVEPTPISSAPATGWRGFERRAGQRLTSSAARSEVKAGVRLDALGRHGVNVPLAQEQVILARDFHLMAIIRAEQHVIADLDRAHVVADREHLPPDQPLRYLGGRRNENPPG